MSAKSRILPLVGPAAVLYLLADAASQTDALSVMFAVAAVASMLCALAPSSLRRLLDLGVPGARRVSLLGLACGLGLAGMTARAGTALTAPIVMNFAAASAAAIALDLAFTIPDSIAHRWRTRWVIYPLAAAIGIWGIMASLPVFELSGTPVVVPGRAERAPILLLAGSIVVALTVRLLRRRFGSTPESLASNTWTVMGLVPGAMLGVWGILSVLTEGLGPNGSPNQGMVVLSAVGGLYGHVSMIDPARRPHAGRTARAAVSYSLSLLVVVVLAATLGPHLTSGPWPTVALCVCLLILAQAIRKSLDPIVQKLLSPFGGRLLDATVDIGKYTGRAESLSELAEAVLSPLRQATDQSDAEPLLFVAEPPTELRLDLAGKAHMRKAAIPPALVHYMRKHQGEIVVRKTLEEHVVRRPHWRPLVEELGALNAFCVVPLLLHQELEGAVVVPLGRRRAALTLEELEALRALGLELAVPVSLMSARLRSQQRVGLLMGDLDRADARIESLEEELGRVQSQNRGACTIHAASSRDTSGIAYGDAMRAVNARITYAAPLDAPILITSQDSECIDELARKAHEQSGRAGGPLIRVDCAQIPTKSANEIMFGAQAGNLGWIRHAERGSLLLVDIAALPLETQKRLSETLATRQARCVHGTSSYATDTRLIATSRVPLSSLVDHGRFDRLLHQYLTGLEIRVPNLSARREDIPSLILLAIDRACRRFGRPPMGIDAPAMNVLLSHPWEEGIGELNRVIEYSVSRNEGSQIQAKHLPTLVSDLNLVNGSDVGTFAAFEKRMLEGAMGRAGGNKSEAARLLGLKRSTFLDKLKRHGIDSSKISKRSVALSSSLRP